MNNQPFQWSAWFRSKTGLVTLIFLAIAAFYLITEHTAHVLGVLPFAIFLLCPLMMLFMHGGHGDDHAQHDVISTGEHSPHTDESTQHAEGHSHHHEEIKP